MVFISLPVHICFASGLRVAPVVIWWSMKYHRLEIPELDGYLTIGGFFEDFREIGGQRWRACRSALPRSFDPSLQASVELRRQIGAESDAVILGCIGREEKMLGERYLETVAEIMKACPNTRFVWTGRAKRSGEVERRLAALGIGARSHFLGWLENTQAATQGIDVYLDSFPFASGHTAFETMSTGSPIVVLRSPEALETSTATAIIPAYEGRAGSASEQSGVRAIFTDSDGTSLLPYVDDVEAYVALSIRLIRDTDYRKRVGRACRAFVETYSPSEKAFAESTCRHIIEIVAEKTGKNSKLLDTPTHL
jgi:glycosyltransferase involved in cell wall biosynthesis